MYSSRNIQFGKQLVQTHEELVLAIHEETHRMMATYGNLGNGYLHMMTHGLDPHGFYGAFKLIVEGIENTLNDMQIGMGMIAAKSDQSVIVNDIMFAGVDYALTYLTAIHDGLDGHLQEMKKALPKMEELVNQIINN